MAFERIAVVGAGAWGIALANMLAQAGRGVTLASRDQANAQALAIARMSPRLPDVWIDARIAIVAAGAAALSAQDAVLVAVPSQQMRAAMNVIAPGLAQIHDRGDRRVRPADAARDPVRTELRRGCGARAADRGDAGGAR
jgi:glycerol-3-phosphate dehydrogenase